MSTPSKSERYDLAAQTRYRYESDLDMFMLYNARNEEFRVAGALAYDIIAGCEDGMSVEEITNHLDVDTSSVQTFCQECADSGFIVRTEEQ